MKRIASFIFPAMMVIFAIAIMACGCRHTPAEQMIISAIEPKATATPSETVECIEWTTAATPSATSVSGIIEIEKETYEPTAAPASSEPTIEPIPDKSETTHVVIEDEEYDIAYEESDESYDGPWPVEAE